MFSLGVPAAGRPRHAHLQALLGVMGATMLLSGAALYNGYPLFYYDSSSHIGTALSGEIFWGRTPFYSLLILPMHQSGSLWPVVFAQSAVIAYLLHLTVRVVFGHVSPAVLLGSTAVLTLVTALPWHTGQVMPDVFAPAVILALFLLACPGEGLSVFERLPVVLLCAIAMATHFSHLLLGGTLIALFLGAVGLRFRRVPVPWTRLGLVLLPLVISIGLLFGSVAWLGGRYRAGPTLTQIPIRLTQPSTWVPYSRIYTLARFMAMGPGKRFLDQECPTRQFLLCPYRDQMPSNAPTFLFSPDSPMIRVGGVEKLRVEAAEIVDGSLAGEPLWHFRLAAEGALLQLITFRSSNGLHPYLDGDTDGGQFVSQAVQRAVPNERPAYLASRQNTRRLPLVGLRRLQGLSAVLSLPFAIVCFVGAARNGHSPFVALGLTLALGLVANATVTGALAGPAGRFQSRVVWLVVWYAVLGAARFRPATPTSASPPRR